MRFTASREHTSGRSKTRMGLESTARSPVATLRFTFRTERHALEPTKDVIVEAKYPTFGCTSAIAASEALGTLIEQGRYTPISALKIQNKDALVYCGLRGACAGCAGAGQTLKMMVEKTVKDLVDERIRITEV